MQICWPATNLVHVSQNFLLMTIISMVSSLPNSCWCLLTWGFVLRHDRIEFWILLQIYKIYVIRMFARACTWLRAIIAMLNTHVFDPVCARHIFIHEHMGTLTLCTPLPQLEFAEIAGVNSPRINSTDCMCQIVTTGTQVQVEVKAARNSPNQAAVRASGTCLACWTFARSWQKSPLVMAVNRWMHQCS